MTRKSVEQEIVAWLEKQGYPLEMYVARVLRSSDFRTRQSEYVLDAATKISREIDVVASRQKEIDGRLLRVTLAIECKRASEKPWLVFTDESIRLAGPARIVQRAADANGQRFLRHIGAKKRDLANRGLFSLPDRPGYSLTEAFTQGKDRAYESLLGVTAAAAGLSPKRRSDPIVSVVFPVLVLEGRLFECHMGEDDQVLVSEVNNCALVWRNPVVNMPHTIVHLSTRAGLPEVVERADITCKDLFRLKTELLEAVGRPRARVRRVVSKGIES